MHFTSSSEKCLLKFATPKSWRSWLLQHWRKIFQITAKLQFLSGRQQPLKLRNAKSKCYRWQVMHPGPLLFLVYEIEVLKPAVEKSSYDYADNFKILLFAKTKQILWLSCTCFEVCIANGTQGRSRTHTEWHDGCSTVRNSTSNCSCFPSPCTWNGTMLFSCKP